MPNDTQVVADGVDQKVESKPSVSRWTLLAIGLLLGVAVVVVFNGDAGQPEVEADTPSAGGRVVPSATPGVVDIAMSEAVRDFPDALVSVASTESGTHEFLIWPRDGSLLARTMTGGETATFDSASQILVMTEDDPASGGFQISTGRHTQITPAVSGVTSFAWHDTNSGHLAYTTEQDGVWSLWHLLPNLNANLIASSTDVGGSVVAWGTWGWAIQAEDDRVRLLTPEGEPKAERHGVAYASNRNGWLFLVGEGAELVSAGGGVKKLDIAEDAVGEPRYATFSNSGDLLAISGTESTQVYRLNGDLVADFGFPVRGVMTFSSDDRFVVAPAPEGVVVFDIERGSRSVVLEQYAVLATSVVPVSGS